ncbi:MAG: hypothetical protein M3164_02925, partial [Actinomycetota bacterium]|nr:hypothetical protein [Actinomycetota bacterium]
AVDSAEEAQRSARLAADAAAECLEQTTNQVADILLQVARTTAAEQVQALVSQALNVAAETKQCASDAGTLSAAGVGEAEQAARFAQIAAAEVEGLGPAAEEAVKVAAEAAKEAATTSQSTLTSVLGIVRQVTALTAGAVNNVVGVHAQLLGRSAPPVTGPPQPTPQPDAVSNLKQIGVDLVHVGTGIGDLVTNTVGGVTGLVGGLLGPTGGR